MIFTRKYIVLFVAALFVVGVASQAGRSQLVNKDVPYIMALWRVNQTTAVIDNVTVVTNHTDFKCAGVLVSSEYALTTISCLDMIKTGIGYRVSAGPLKREDHSRIKFHEIEEVIPHYRYNKVTKENDIALIKIKSPGFANEPNVAPIKIHRRQTAPGTMCSAAGWRTSFYYWSDDLRTKTVFRLDDATCNAVIAGYTGMSGDVKTGDVSSDGVKVAAAFQPPRLNFGGRKICAADKYNEECNVGDEGGPLVCNGALAGIFSNYILVCLQTDPEPAFYHDVTHYAVWIAAHAPGAKFY